MTLTLSKKSKKVFGLIQDQVPLCAFHYINQAKKNQTNKQTKTKQKQKQKQNKKINK